LPIPELFRTSTFRLTASFAATFAASTVSLFAFIYWQTTVVETERVNDALVRDAAAIASEEITEVRQSLKLRLAADYHRVTYASLFTKDGQPIIGNMDRLPNAVRPDGLAQRTTIDITEAGEIKREVVLLVARRLANGQILVIGRSVDSLDNLRTIVVRALEGGGAPALLLALAVGALLSRRTQRQVQSVHLAAERIMRGDLRERLPVRGSFDDIDRLAGSVNHLLDEIERLIEEAKNTTDNIAHDLRTPLTRVRSRLERARESAKTREELQEMVDRSIIGLDQTLRIITALLRISQIEGGRRRANFSSVDLTTVVAEMGDLLEPFAEEQGVQLIVEAAATSPLLGDRDLLSEAIANLVDNAIKFTPSGGQVRLSAAQEENVPVLRVIDTGPGIPPDEREAVIRRFYRSDKSRHIEGFGLGLSLVDAIVKLHGFRLLIGEGEGGEGCVFELRCGEKD
jgi:hypothetical protein